jgi:YaiO family outer membrane protein
MIATAVAVDYHPLAMSRLTSILLLAILLNAAASRAESDDPLARARELAASGDRTAALQLLEQRLVVAPDDVDARVLYGTILSWQGDDDGARRALQAALQSRPSMPDAVVALARVELLSGHPSRSERLSGEALQTAPDNADLIMVHADALVALNRKPEALAEAVRALAADPLRDDARRMRRILRQELSSSEVAVAVNYDRYGDGIDPLREVALSVRRNTTFGAALVRVAHAQRFGLDDDQLELEAFPRYRSTSAYLAADYAPQATLYPHSRYAAEIFQAIPAGFEASLGFRRLNFASPTDLYTASAAYYHRSWYLGGRLYRQTGDVSHDALQVAARRYFAGDSQYVGIRAGKGATRDELRRASDLDDLASNEIAAEAMLLLHERWALHLTAGAGRQTLLGRRVTHSSVISSLGFRF